jgi:hypothetical protein
MVIKNLLISLGFAMSEGGRYRRASRVNGIIELTMTYAKRDLQYESRQETSRQFKYTRQARDKLTSFGEPMCTIKQRYLASYTL